MLCIFGVSGIFIPATFINTPNFFHILIRGVLIYGTCKAIGRIEQVAG